MCDYVKKKKDYAMKNTEDAVIWRPKGKKNVTAKSWASGYGRLSSPCWDNCISYLRTLVQVQAPQLWSSFLLTCILGGSPRWFKYMGPYHPCGRSRWCPRLLALTWPCPGCYRHLWGELADGRSLSLSASLIKMKINKKFFKRGELCPSPITHL